MTTGYITVLVGRMLDGRWHAELPGSGAVPSCGETRAEAVETLRVSLQQEGNGVEHVDEIRLRLDVPFTDGSVEHNGKERVSDDAVAHKDS